MSHSKLRTRRLLRAVGVLLIASATACDSFYTCTLIGCANGLALDFGTNQAGPFRVEIQSQFGTANTFECKAALQCRFAFFEEFYPQTATVTVIRGAITKTTTVTPVYSESRPNGEHCGPTCRHATAAVEIPAG